MECHAASDLDLLIVLDDRGAAVSEETAATLFNEVWRRIEPTFVKKLLCYFSFVHLYIFFLCMST